MNGNSTMVVPINSAWYSKINWTQAVSTAAMLFTVFGVDLDPKTQVSIVASIQGAQSVATWVLRTWFTTSITPASV